MSKIFVTRKIPDVGTDLLKEKGHEVDISEKDGVLTKEELIKELNLTCLTIVEPEEVQKLTKYKVPQQHTIKEGIQAQRDQLYHRLKIDQ